MSEDTTFAAGPARHRAAIATVLAAAVAFGALDQYIGSRYMVFATAVSGMSARWLLLPFLAGLPSRSVRQAAWTGFAATWLAVAAYVLMIDSPAEGVRTTAHIIAVTTASQWPWFAGGAVSGPVYGLFGYWWHIRRSRLSAALAATPLIFEPVVVAAGLKSSGSVAASCAEAAVGLIVAGCFAVAVVRLRRQVAADTL